MADPTLANLFPGAVIAASGATVSVATDAIVIPVEDLNSFGNATAASGLEIGFALVDTVSAAIASTGDAAWATTSTSRIIDADTIRRDYTFRFNLAYSVSDLDVE